MRFYEISLIQPGSSSAPVTFSSHPNGQYDPCALNVLFDMPVLPYHTPAGGQTIQIEGIPLSAISQAEVLANMIVTVKGGMQSGLPLANPAQAGVLVQGQVFQSWGNWEGTEMVLALMLNPASYTMDDPGNFTLVWRAGQPLSTALQNMFSVVYPNQPVSMNIGSNIVNDTDFIHRASTLEGLAGVLHDFTDTMFSQPVYHTIQAGKIVVYDKTYQPAPIQLAFTDFIGQPTWIDQQTMQVKTVMRADIQVGAIIAMPQGFQNAPGLITTQGSSLPSSNKYKSAFQNNFTVSELRHIGDYRSPDGSAWATIFNCIENAAST